MTGSLSDKIFLGNRASDMETGDVFRVTRVNLTVDSDNYYTAGDDTGQTIEVTCPWGTQEMANSILASVQGYQYQPYTAEDALLDPAAEIGDAVTLSGVYSVISSINTVFDRACAPEISAPGSDEIDDEYPYESKEQKETNRQLAQTRSMITKTAEEIRLEVEDELNGLSSSFTVQLNSIRSQITGINGDISTIDQRVDSITLTVQSQGNQISTIEQKVNSIRLSVSNGADSSTITLTVNGVAVSSQNITFSGVVTFTDLAGNGTTVINGNNITTGTISANRLDLTGAITFDDLSNEVYNNITDAYDLAQEAQNTVGGWVYPGSTYIDGGMIMTGTVSASNLRGGSVGILNSRGSEIGYFTVGSSTSTGIQLVCGGNLYFESASCGILMTGTRIGVECNSFYPSGYAADLGSSSLGMWDAVYAYTGEIQTSDQNLKHNIEELPEKYLTMLDNLQVKRFKLNSGRSNRYHVGFIAQDVKAAMDAVGITSEEFGGWCTDTDEEGNEIQMLRMGEILSIMLAKIKKLESQVNE